MTHNLNDLELAIAKEVLRHKPDSESKIIEYLDWAKTSNVYPLKLLSGKDDSDESSTFLSSLERDVSRMIGPMRTKAARAAGLPNQLVADLQHENKMEYLGIAGEIAYGKKFNLYPVETFEIKPRTTKEDKGDYVHNFDREFCIDVKITDRDNGRLLLAPWKITNRNEYLNKVHCLALYTGDIDKSSELKFRGYLTTSKMINRPMRSMRHGGPELYWAFQEELTMKLEDVYKEWLNE